MNYAMMIKQVLDFNKKAFDDSFSTVVTVQEHAEKMASVFWEKAEFFPEEGKKVVEDWVTHYKNALDAFKDDVDNRFKLVENYILNAAEQIQGSFHSSVAKTDWFTPAERGKIRKVATGTAKAVTRKTAVKSEKGRPGKVRKQK